MCIDGQECLPVSVWRAHHLRGRPPIVVIIPAGLPPHGPFVILLAAAMFGRSVLAPACHCQINQTRTGRQDLLCMEESEKHSWRSSPFSFKLFLLQISSVVRQVQSLRYAGTLRQAWPCSTLRSQKAFGLMHVRRDCNAKCTECDATSAVPNEQLCSHLSQQLPRQPDCASHTRWTSQRNIDTLPPATSLSSVTLRLLSMTPC